MEQNQTGREAQQRIAVRLTAQEGFLVRYLNHINEELQNTISTDVEPDSALVLRDAFRSLFYDLKVYRQRLNEYRGEVTTTLQDANNLVDIIEQEWKKELEHIPEMVIEIQEAVDR